MLRAEGLPQHAPKCRPRAAWIEALVAANYSPAGHIAVIRRKRVSRLATDAHAYAQGRRAPVCRPAAGRRAVQVGRSAIAGRCGH